MLAEIQIVSIIQQFIVATPMRIAIAVFLARWLVFVYIAFLIVLFREKKPLSRHAVFEACWAFMLTLVLTAIFSQLVGRARPFLEIPTNGFPILGLIPPPLNTSFPSGHTGAAFAISAAIFFVNRRLGLLAFFIALLVAFGRAAVGVHYPTDLLGGMVVGVGAFILVRFCHHQLRAKDLRRSVAHHHHP